MNNIIDKLTIGSYPQTISDTNENITIMTGGCPKLKIDRINIYFNTTNMRREQYVILEDVEDDDLIYAMQQIGMDLRKELVKDLKEFIEEAKGWI